MKIVVTGLSGNVGTALLSALSSPPPFLADLDLHGISRRTPPPSPPYSLASWHALDLATASPSDLAPILRGADAVVHLTWGFQPSHDTAYLDAVALQGTQALLSAIKDTEVPHLVHMSSVGAYAPHPGSSGHLRPGFPERVDESWPATGMPSLAYALQKAGAESLLDEFETSSSTTVTRLRPGIIAHAAAASGLLRYGVPAWLPLPLLSSLPVLPLPSFATQVVHAADVASAILLSLEKKPSGALNLAAEPVVTPRLIADLVKKPLLPLPRALTRSLVSLSWHARLQPLDPGWLDLAFHTPLMDTTRARSLGWSPLHSSRATLQELFSATSSPPADTPSPPLRHRSVLGELRHTLTHGLVSERKIP